MQYMYNIYNTVRLIHRNYLSYCLLVAFVKLDIHVMRPPFPTPSKAPLMCFTARHELLEAKGLEYHPDIPAYALSELTMKYRSPLRATESYIVTVSVQVFKKARVILKQRVIFLHDDGPQKDQVRLLQMFLKLYMAISLPQGG